MILTAMTKAIELLGTEKFRNAVGAVQMRAEKQTDWTRVLETFVRSDLLARVNSPDSQLILGRRGTGKTHLLRVFQTESLRGGGVVYLFDCTNLGSAASSANRSPDQVAADYFQVFLNQLGTEFLDELDRSHLLTDKQKDVVVNKLAAGLTPSGGSGLQSLNFRQISDTLTQVLREMNIGRLSIVLDEWAQVPFESQPFFAEFVKRTLLTVPAITVKILAVNYQCNLLTRVGNNPVGLERGADLPNVIDMDRYLIWDERKDDVTGFFAQLLYNHLGIELRLDLDVPSEEKRRWVEELFTQKNAFHELVRAAEGNPRDFLCIFAKAYFDEYKSVAGSKSISVRNIVNAAVAWYDETKAKNIVNEKTATETLQHIMNKVLKGYKARTFMVEVEKAEHRRLIRLLNERILHRLSGTYSHPDRPGVRHDLFAIDYGAFARFRGTKNAIHEEAFWDDQNCDELNSEEKAQLVPVDDKRSIRRITFDPDTLETTGDVPTQPDADQPPNNLFSA